MCVCVCCVWGIPIAVYGVCSFCVSGFMCLCALLFVGICLGCLFAFVLFLSSVV